MISPHKEIASAADLEVRRNVTSRLRDIIDPEIGVNIVDLGLLYAIELTDRHTDTHHLIMLAGGVTLLIGNAEYVLGVGYGLPNTGPV